MKSIVLCVVLGLGLVAPVAAGEPFRMALDAEQPGTLPKGWVAAKTGQGPGSVWKVVAEATAPGGKALAQTSPDGPRRLFNLCVAEGTRFTDLDLAVSMRPVAGKVDQGGGLVWRYQDADNYYVARLNPLESNFRVYKVIAGTRTQLGTADVRAAAGQWYRLRVVQAGEHIRCYLDEKLYLDVRDASIPQLGKIGLWTKADAQTQFAGLTAAAKRD